MSHPKPGPILATLALFAISGCTDANLGSRANVAAVTATSDSLRALAYEGVNNRRIPNYATAINLSSDDARVLRVAYGIEDPHRLYVSDSTEEGILKYDTQVKRCADCYVNSYRVGYASIRRFGESWEQAERRVRGAHAGAFRGSGNWESNALADLDPDVRVLSQRMLLDARSAGFNLRVIATYRSPIREAFLMAEGGGQTHTLTSNHSYGRALDIVVDDGRLSHARTRRDWISFRRWVTHYRTPTDESFRILGKLDKTWDWPHVELPSSEIGFSTIEKAVRRGRACLMQGATVPCNFQPHLPAHISRELIQ